ncbi:MAG: MliC family protein [Thiomonas sp.]
MNPQQQRSLSLRLGASCAALGVLALTGCATPVNLNQPVPVQQLNPPTPRVTVPPSTYAPVTPQAPTSEAQPLAPSAPITVQPLGPAGIAPATNAPSQSPSPSQFAPAAPAPEGSAPQQGAPALPPGAVRFNCQDGSSFIATFGDVSVTLQTALGNLTLDQTVSADGARYRNSAFQVWFKGRQATVTNFLQNTNTVCQQQ